MDIAAIFGISGTILSTIVGLVQLIKWWLRKKIKSLVDMQKKWLNRIWVAIVGGLAIGAAIVLTMAAGWSWTMFIPLAFSYFVGAQGLYATGKAILPLPKNEEE